MDKKIYQKLKITKSTCRLKEGKSRIKRNKITTTTITTITTITTTTTITTITMKRRIKVNSMKREKEYFLLFLSLPKLILNCNRICQSVGFSIIAIFIMIHWAKLTIFRPIKLSKIQTAQTLFKTCLKMLKMPKIITTTTIITAIKRVGILQFLQN